MCVLSTRFCRLRSLHVLPPESARATSRVCYNGLDGITRRKSDEGSPMRTLSFLHIKFATPLSQRENLLCYSFPAIILHMVTMSPTFTSPSVFTSPLRGTLPPEEPEPSPFCGRYSCSKVRIRYFISRIP